MRITDKNRDKLVDILEFLGVDPDTVCYDGDIEFTVTYPLVRRYNPEPLGGYEFGWPERGTPCDLLHTSCSGFVRQGRARV